MGTRKFENRIWLSSPTMHGDEMKYVQEAYDTNWMSTAGENINKLEEGISKYVGVKYSVALASGTAALHMATKLAALKPGEKFFCSDLTFAATVNPALYENATPIFIDCEYETWNMDPVALEKAFELYPEVRVVYVVHLYGVPAQIGEIKKICDKNGAILIEDAAESLGASYDGVQTGCFGKYSAISFNGNKIITGSSGGMFLSDDEDAADRVRKWSTQSREPAPWYQHEEIGYNYRISNIAAGIARGQLLHLDEHIQSKQRIYERYKEGFTRMDITLNPYISKVSSPNFWLSCMLIDKEALSYEKRGKSDYEYKSEPGKTSPMELLDTLLKYNVESRPIWKPMHMQPIFENCIFITKDGVWKKGDTCVDEDIFKRGLCLPSDVTMTEEEQEGVIEIIKKCFE